MAKKSTKFAEIAGEVKIATLLHCVGIKVHLMFNAVKKEKNTTR
jgi:hypothetical protein